MIITLWEVYKKILIAALILGFIIAFVNVSPEKKNRKNGEKYEKRVLQYIKEYLGVNAYHHLLFCKNDGATSETDIAFATKKGVFCVECKYTSLSVKPTVSLSMDRWDMGKYLLNNPFNQNDAHIKWVKEYLSDIPSLQSKPITIYNVVCVDFGFIFKRFVSQYDSDKNPYVPMPDEGKILLTTQYKSLAKKAFTLLGAGMYNMPDVFTESEVMEINNILSLHVATKEQLRKHVEDMKRRS